MTTPDRYRSIIKDLFRQISELREEIRAAATEVLALKITYGPPDPNDELYLRPEGKFEIMFMSRKEADIWHKGRITSGLWANSMDVTEEVSFAEGVELARHPDCHLGHHALIHARRFAEINPVVAALNLDI